MGHESCGLGHAYHRADESSALPGSSPLGRLRQLDGLLHDPGHGNDAKHKTSGHRANHSNDNQENVEWERESIGHRNGEEPDDHRADAAKRNQWPPEFQRHA